MSYNKSFRLSLVDYKLDEETLALGRMVPVYDYLKPREEVFVSVAK